MNRKTPLSSRYRRAPLLLLMQFTLSATACFKQESQICAEGLVCPPGLKCAPDGKSCIENLCGDGELQDGEACDDGNKVDTDECLHMCQLARCGDGFVQTGVEACDDRGESQQCNANCTLTHCGDGIKNQRAGELCDDGNRDDGDECLNSCVPARCGDGFVMKGVEECDPQAKWQLCDVDCTLPICRDGVVNVLAGEQCDDHNDINDDECTNGCQIPRCGDRIVQAGEECDEGGRQTENCNYNCKKPDCGDGILNFYANEECDDGNKDKNDGCSDACKIERCGDGVKNGPEHCDSGGRSRVCDYDCTKVECGDNVVNPMAGEQCDEGRADTANCNYGDGGTKIACRVPVCGDGYRNADAGEVCDYGYVSYCGSCQGMCRIGAPRNARGGIAVVAGSKIRDGEKFLIEDGKQGVWFEFDNDGGVSSKAVAVVFSDAGVYDVAINVRNAIERATTLKVEVKVDGGYVELENKYYGLGNRGIVELVADPDFIVEGMSGGVGRDCPEGERCVVDSDCADPLKCVVDSDGQRTCGSN